MEAKRFPLFISESVVRSVAFQVLLLTALAILLRSPWIALFLALDFALRSIVTPKISPLALIARKLIVPRVRKKRAPMPFRPKRFAAAIGLTMSVAACIFGFTGIYPGFYIVLGILALFSSLEGFVGFCAGCKIFVILMKLRIISVDNCPECANLLERQKATQE